MTMINGVSGQQQELPPIVLLIEEDREELDRYSRGLEGEGLWVAAATVPGEAAAVADELRPDLIIVDCDRESRAAVPSDILESLNEHASRHHVPLILLASQAQDGNQQRALLKPVSVPALVQRTHEVLARSRELRERARQLSLRRGELQERSTRLIEKSVRLAAAQGAGPRPCPECRGLLDWVERGAVGGVTYDYYRWCLNGCGLYCFDRDRGKWVKLG